MKKFSSIYCILAFVLIFVTNAFAQLSYYRNQGDLVIIGGFSTNETSNNVGGLLGYNITPAFSIGFDFTHISFKDVELSANRILPIALFYPIQQNEKIPLTAYAQAAYFHGSFSSSELDNLGLSLSSNGFNFGFGVFTEQMVSEIFSIIPGGGVEFIIGKTKLKDDLGNSISENSTTTIFNINSMFVLGASNNVFVYALPNLSISEGETTPGISFGLGFRNRKPSLKAKSRDLDQDLSDFDIEDPVTKLPNFRAAVPTANKYTDDEILELFKKKYPNLKQKSDDQLIELIEKKYKTKNQN